MALLVAQEIVKRYQKRLVVDAASLRVASGEVVGLLGPNGAGKTTSFYMMVGLVRSDAGRVLLDDQDLTHLPMHARARLGVSYLPQEPSIFRRLNVLDNVLAVLQTRHDLNRTQQRALAESLLHELHVGHLHDNLGLSLSGGERRRVEIARALAANPLFILLDEPFAGVDPLSVMDIQRIIKHLSERNIGVLITDHNVRETLGICNRAYILNEGRVIAEGSPAHILDNQQVRQVYLGDSFQL